MSHEIQDFETDVIERSRHTPVLVDFWAEWCGPCRMLGPVLEKLEGEADGAWVLAKVDVDHNREVAASYQVQGIPAVKLFVDGGVVAEFTGAVPESQVARWLDANLPSETKARLAQAVELLRGGDVERARQALEALLGDPALDQQARVLLAQVTVFEAPERAGELVAEIGPDSDFAAAAGQVRTLSALLLRDPADLPEAPVREEYAAGLETLRGGDIEEALERFIAVLGRNKHYDEDGARRACIALFDYLGREHPISMRLRRRFQSALN